MKGPIGPASLKWGDVDENSAVLAIFHRDVVIATMRAEPILSWTDSSLVFDGQSLPLSHTLWPSLSFSRAATVRGERSHGLNSILRYHLIQAAHEAGIERVYGYVLQGAPRTQMMIQMGYKFLQKGAHSYLPSPKPWAIAYLDLTTKGAFALKHLETSLGAHLKDFRWDGPRLDFSHLKVGVSKRESIFSLNF